MANAEINITLDSTPDQEPKYPGEPVRLFGRDLIVPSLSVKQARELWPEILSIDQGITIQNLPEKWAQSLRIVLAAVRRNYPDVTFEQLEEAVDVKMIRGLLLIVAGQSGMAPGETAPGGGRAATAPVVQ